MGKGNNNDNYKPVGYIGHCEFVSNPTIGLVTTQPNINPVVTYSSNPNQVQSKSVVTFSSKPNQVQCKSVVTFNSKPNHVQNKSVVTYSSKPNQVQSYETTSRVKNVDKQTGNYQRVTTKEKVSNSNVHKERGTGQVGVKNENKKTSTVRIGNSSGYTEYHTEKRVRKVDFGNGGSNKRLKRGGY